jgi:hypothetical protein
VPALQAAGVDLVDLALAWAFSGAAARPGEDVELDGARPGGLVARQAHVRGCLAGVDLAKVAPARTYASRRRPRS